ncbi:hypothetical protein UA08_00219 [Talaromyces atroroseus]|uniref:CDP-diacylglycerol--glycerol-3-phosphate 3-phosphatidyltransferase n=1 Tax=Talaromyces atroroseus TaxID=1441469 RepID=A0A225ARV1_TALAT|nr:hypothetical protein UA08_00219 [Talaromyces atroroseus]OKL64311.1 hypothetical protein UA08_00219 [Talaromyces atroroseus]
MFKRVGEHAVRCTCRRSAIRRQVAVRKFSVYNSPNAPATSTASPLGGLTTELDRIAPRFEVPSSKITILDSPSSFYETLKHKIRNARRRIYLSTLYIGKTEHELVDTVNQALRDNPNLHVSILTDCLRGTRETPNPSSASLLARLVEEHGSDRVEIRMFHTPNLTGLRKKANLSEDYFTNRVDRYHVFNSKELTDYYGKIHDAICHLSFQVLPNAENIAGYELVWPSSNSAHSPLDDPEGFISQSSSALHSLIQPRSQEKAALVPTSEKTLVYPVAQLTPLLKPDTSTEFPAVTSILRLLTSSPMFRNSHWLFTAGYFNIHPTLSSLLIESTSYIPTTEQPATKTQGTVLTASPWANGFYGSPGISGMLPAAYTHLSARFLDRVAEAQRTNSIQLREWRRGTVGEPGGWTYHAKGLWITLPNDKYPSLTFVGSSNYTKRSYGLDLEVGALVVTSDDKLKQRLHEETEWLQENSKPVSREDLRRTERRVGWNVRLAMWIVEKVGGAL